MKKMILLILSLFVFSCDSSSNGGEGGIVLPPDGPIEEGYANIIGEWDAMTLDIDVLDDMAGCSYEDDGYDASHMNWAFQTNGVVEQNDSNPGVWTVEKYFEYISNRNDLEYGNVTICSNEDMTTECIIYTVAASKHSLSLTTMIVEGDACDREETLYFIPEDD